MAADGNYPALVRSVRNPNSFFSRLKSLSSYSFVSLNLSLEFDTGERNQLMKKQKTSSSKALRMMEEEDFHDYGNDFHEGSRDGEREIKKMELKSDHANRPLLACADVRIFLETFFPLYKQAYDFLVAVTEPVCRHEYNLTPHTLCAAVSVGLKIETIISVLSKLLENEVATWGKLEQSVKGTYSSFSAIVGLSYYSKCTLEPRRQ